MMAFKNHWLYSQGKRRVIRIINGLLQKFIGRKIMPLDKLFNDLRGVVISYFKKEPDHLKYFTDGITPFDYNFEVEEQNGHVTNIDFQA